MRSSGTRVYEIVLTGGGSQFQERIFLSRDPTRLVLTRRFRVIQIVHVGSDLAENICSGAPRTPEDSRPPLGISSYLGMAVSPRRDPCKGKAPARGAQWTNAFLLGRRPWCGGAKGDIGGGWGGSCALESRGRRWSRRHRPRAAGSQRRVRRGRAGHASASPSTPCPSPLGIGSDASTRIM